MQSLRSDSRQRELILAALLVLPFFLNDLFFMAARTEAELYLGDAAIRVVVLAAIPFVPAFRTYVRAAFPDPRERFRSWPLAVAALILIPFACLWGDYLIQTHIGPVIGKAFPDLVLFTYPAITTPWLRAFDISAGLALVAVSEELVFRVLLTGTIARFSQNRVVLVVATSLIFGLIHWSKGPANVVTATLTGAMLMIVFLASKGILPSILAHYVIDVWLYA